ncbi:MAG: TolC family protein [Ferruginibacter sp.]
MEFQKYILALLTFILFSRHTFSQADKQVTFTPEAFIQQVRLYHPVAKQANILVDKAAAGLLSAKGGFDPVMNADASRKTFDGVNYYYYTNPELKIPTPIGIDIKTGLENNGGNFLNPEISAGKTSYLGLEIPLVKGLMMDKRRAVLQQAKIFQQQSEQERLVVLNDLLFAAYTDYWQWAGAFQMFSIYSRFADVANNRLRLVRIAYINGDRATIDTIEAFTQVQNYQLQQSEALLRLNEAAFGLSNYLWRAGDIPSQLPSQYVPDTIQFAMTMVQQPIDDFINQSTIQNPALKSYELKLNSLEVERKLKFQSLLPIVNLSANLLNKDYYALKGLDAALLQNNYKWGIEFKLPLFLREGRGAYRQAKMKIRETDLQLIYKRWQIENKIRSYYNENFLLLQQLQTAQSIYNNYYSLLRNEELKFTQGESSLFLVNSRETKVLELLQKQVELRFKYFKSGYAIEWSAGLLR